jgi:hypothetical protein
MNNYLTVGVINQSFKTTKFIADRSNYLRERFRKYKGQNKIEMRRLFRRIINF